jgi:hypothetical protein
MGDMHGSTFQTSRTDRERLRAAGPALTLVRGTADDAPARPRVAPRAHPAFEGFTPDDVPGGTALTAVHRSGPGSPSARRASRGSNSPDVGGSAHSGPGPHASQAELVRRLADHLAEHDARCAAPPATAAGIRRIH